MVDAIHTALHVCLVAVSVVAFVEGLRVRATFRGGEANQPYRIYLAAIAVLLITTSMAYVWELAGPGSPDVLQTLTLLGGLVFVVLFAYGFHVTLRLWEPRPASESGSSPEVVTDEVGILAAIAHRFEQELSEIVGPKLSRGLYRRVADATMAQLPEEQRQVLRQRLQLE